MHGNESPYKEERRLSDGRVRGQLGSRVPGDKRQCETSSPAGQLYTVKCRKPGQKNYIVRLSRVNAHKGGGRLLGRSNGERISHGKDVYFEGQSEPAARHCGNIEEYTIPQFDGATGSPPKKRTKAGGSDGQDSGNTRRSQGENSSDGGSNQNSDESRESRKYSDRNNGMTSHAREE